MVFNGLFSVQQSVVQTLYKVIDIVHQLCKRIRRALYRHGLERFEGFEEFDVPAGLAADV
jgi:hypothetical protein